MRSSITPSPSQLQSKFLIFAVVGVSVLFLWMVKAFLMALLLGAITAGLTNPVFERLSGWIWGRRVVASVIIVIGLILLVIGPLSALLTVVVSQAVEITQDVGPWVEGRIAQRDEFSGWLERLPFPDWLPFDPVLPDRERVIELLGNTVKGTGSVLVDGLAAAGRGTATFMLQLFIFLYAVFFFLLSGRETLDRVLYLSPLDAEDEDLIIDRFLSVTRATLRGSLLIGGLQGLLTGLAFSAAGVPGAAFWGTIVVVLSVIPGVGAPIVWLPAVIWLLVTGSTWPGILLALWCGLVVGSIDNVLRPRLVGSDAKMTDLMILISTLGGISLFGPVGFIVGPIVAAVFVTLWGVYGRAFESSLPPLGLPDASPAASAAAPEPEGTPSNPV